MEGMIQWANRKASLSFLFGAVIDGKGIIMKDSDLDPRLFNSSLKDILTAC